MSKRKKKIKETPKNTLNKKTVFISIFLIIVLGFAVYANSLGGQFIWDDLSLIKNNTYIRSSSSILNLFTKDIGSGAAGEHYGFYRPLQMLTYRWDYTLWKLDVKGYHLTNTILHILAALSLYWLVGTLFKDNFLALLTSLLFVSHPIHTEAVAYISGRADPLAAVFIFLCFVFYIRQSEHSSTGRYLLMLTTYILALLAKEYSLILPALILLYHYSFKKKFALKEFISIAAVTLSYIVIRFTLLDFIVGSKPPETTLSERIPGLFVALTNYLRLLVLPFNLHMEYGGRFFTLTDPKLIGGVILLISLLTYAYKAKKKNQLVSFSIFWFFIALFPVSNLYPINAYMAEHWLYLPSIGFFLIIAKALVYLFRIKKFKSIGLVVIIGLLSFYSLLTFKQNEYWREPIGFFKRTLQYTNNSSRLYNNLGLLYKDNGEYEKAASCYNKAIEIDPEYTEAYNNLGLVYENTGEYEKAISCYEKALEIVPQYSKAYGNLGIVYESTGEYKEAISSYKKALEIEPNYAKAYSNLGIVYGNLGRYEEAISCYNKALKIDPEYPNAYNNLGNAYFNTKKYEEAISCYKKALEIEPDYAKAYNNLGVVYKNAGKYAEAISCYKRALEIDPKYTKTYNNLGNAYEKAGKYKEAISSYKKALESDPEYLDAHINLAFLYYNNKDYNLAIQHCDKAIELGYNIDPNLVEALRPFRK